MREKKNIPVFFSWEILKQRLPSARWNLVEKRQTLRSFLAHLINKEGLVWLCSDPGSVVQSCHKQSEWYQKTQPGHLGV